MTREEAIKILSARDNRGLPITWQDGFVEAYDMAIKSLEGNTWIPCSERLPETTNEVLDKIRAEIKEWYWQADKQALAKDPCVVDAMVDLFIRTIDKYKAESEK